MHPSRLPSLRNFLPLVTLVVPLFAIYLNTLAPGLSWANDGSDGGDLIAAAATGGVAHPTGYPTYLLLARLFQALPVGSLAFRTNLMSAVFAALAAGFVYRLCIRSIESRRTYSASLAGLVAGYAFGLAPLIWSQAVITEVYALQAFFVALVLYLYTAPTHNSHIRRKTLDRYRGLALGLALGNHITTILLIPIALLAGSLSWQPVTSDTQAAPRSLTERPRLDKVSLLRQLAWLGVGLSVYLLIPLRAMAHPPVNWGNAVTAERFWWLVSGRLYQVYYPQFTLSGVWERVQASTGVLVEQFGLAGVALGILGLVVSGARSRLYLLTIWVAVTSLVFAIVYRSDDSYVYLLPACLSFAIWIGIAIDRLAEQFSRRLAILGACLVILSLSYFAARSLVQMPKVDASSDHRAESFGRQVLSAVPENAMIFAEGDHAVFALWYFHFALGERPDVAVMAADLLHFDWYQDNLHAAYPSLILPAPFPWPETIVIANPGRSGCYVRYDDRTEIDCSDPLASP
jgi:hypothetical protein